MWSHIMGPLAQVCFHQGSFSLERLKKADISEQPRDPGQGKQPEWLGVYEFRLLLEFVWNQPKCSAKPNALQLHIGQVNR